MAIQSLISGDFKIRNENGILIAVDGIVFADTSGTIGTSGTSGTSGSSTILYGTSGTVIVIPTTTTTTAAPITTTTTTTAPTTTTTTAGGPLVAGIDANLYNQTSGALADFKIKYSPDGINWSIFYAYPSYSGGYPQPALYSPIALGYVGEIVYIALTDMSDNNIRFGIGNGGSFTTYCGISNPYAYTPLVQDPTIWINIALSAGQYVQC